MKRLLVSLFIFAFVVQAGAAQKKSMKSYSGAEPYRHNWAVSASLGLGVPVGDFSNSQVGNAGTGGIANLQGEYFIDDRFSLGFEISRGILQDDRDNNLENRVNNYQVLGRYLVPLDGRVRPYGKANLGLSTITYRDENFGGMGTLTSTSDPGLSLGLSGGALWRISRSWSFNGGMGYHVAFLSGSEVANSGSDVGYNPAYFSLDLGASFFFGR